MKTLTCDLVAALSRFGFVEFGGGNEFIAYHIPQLPWHNVYLFDNGHWEYHNLEEQLDDSPEQAEAKGYTVRGLVSQLGARS